MTCTNTHWGTQPLLGAQRLLHLNDTEESKSAALWIRVAEVFPELQNRSAQAVDQAVLSQATHQLIHHRSFQPEY